MKKIILIVTMALTLGSCNKLDELLVNPNAPDPSNGNVDLYFTQTQLSFVQMFNSLSLTHIHPHLSMVPGVLLIQA
jgi:hypothetical protein